MQNAETVLGVLRDRGSKGLPTGQPAWAALMVRKGVRPWWSAVPATTPSTGIPPLTRRRSLESHVHRKSAPSNSALGSPPAGG
jgi:hypothetical protein